MPIFQRLRRLQWKLTLTYTLVTIAVLGVIFIALVAGVTAYLYSGDRQIYVLEAGLSQLAPEVQPMLEKNPPDTLALNNWINGIDRSQKEGPGLYLADPANRVIVTGAQGQVLASTQPDEFPAGENISTLMTGKGLNLVQSVLAGVADQSALAARENDQFFVAVAPVQSGKAPILGTIILRTRGPNILPLIARLLRTVLPIVAAIALGVVLMGTIFGALTAGGLTSRLRKITDQAGRWGRGDFSGRIQDSSVDEIGKMADELNRIAGDLQTLIQERQRLAADNEHSRMARDLHDSVKQQVFAISMNLAAAQALWDGSPAESRNRLDQAASLAREAQNELISLIQGQSAPPQEKHELGQRLVDLARAWEKQSGIQMDCFVGDEAQASPEIGEALYRITQEALANISRHSGANASRLRLVAASEGITLSIQDNGHGFSTTQESPGLGLHSMRERAQSLGGELSLQSGPAGTCLEIRIPVDGEMRH